MKKRRYHYIQNPKEYDITCDKCGGLHIEWSEYVDKIWCYDCKIDTDGKKGIFDGPIPVMLCTQVFGTSFDRYDMETKQIIKYGTPKWKNSWEK